MSSSPASLMLTVTTFSYMPEETSRIEEESHKIVSPWKDKESGCDVLCKISEFGYFGNWAACSCTWHDKSEFTSVKSSLVFTSTWRSSKSSENTSAKEATILWILTSFVKGEFSFTFPLHLFPFLIIKKSSIHQIQNVNANYIHSFQNFSRQKIKTLKYCT